MDIFMLFILLCLIVIFSDAMTPEEFKDKLNNVEE